MFRYFKVLKRVISRFKILIWIQDFIFKVYYKIYFFFINLYVIVIKYDSPIPISIQNIFLLLKHQYTLILNPIYIYLPSSILYDEWNEMLCHILQTWLLWFALVFIIIYPINIGRRTFFNYPRYQNILKTNIAIYFRIHFCVQ